MRISPAAAGRMACRRRASSLSTSLVGRKHAPIIGIAPYFMATLESADAEWRIAYEWYFATPLARPVISTRIAYHASFGDAREACRGCSRIDSAIFDILPELISSITPLSMCLLLALDAESCLRHISAMAAILVIIAEAFIVSSPARADSRCREGIFSIDAM